MLYKEIIGHEQIIEYFRRAFVSDKISHAYILNGLDGSGKTMLAEAFALMTQCEELEKIVKQESFDLSELSRIDGCCKCRSCGQVIRHNHPDIKYIQPESSKVIKVDDIRKQINNDIVIRPYNGRRKIYIVDDAQKMNANAQNALLKTLEEPPAYATIILMTNNADAFLQTIRSRCIQLNLQAVPNDKIKRYLMKEKKVPDYRADICVAFSQGSVGRAQDLAISESFNEIKDIVVKHNIRLKKTSYYQLGDMIAEYKEYKDQYQEILDLMLMWYRDVLVYKASEDEDKLNFADRAYDIKLIANNISFEGGENIIKEISRARRRLRANVDPTLTFQMLLINIKENFL